MAARFFTRRLVGVLLFGLADAAGLVGLAALMTVPSGHRASAQVFDDRFPFLEERARRGGGGRDNCGGFFCDNRQAPAAENNAKAPPPARKSESVPLTSVVVLGDSMADWLAYGLEQAAVDSPDIGILRRHRTNSGLIRVDVKNDPHGEYPDWPQAAREILNADKVNFIVVMIGLNDRRPIREKAPAKTPASEKDKAKDKESKDRAVDAEMVTYEFRSDAWTEAYIKRIDETIAVLKAKNVPVFWVGLPPVRTASVSADLSYLNDLFRSRAEKAGITYIDTWDGFVDEAGRFVMQGPDFEGQIRRLRSGDGVHFTQAGARKLAHYVEREIQRALMASAAPVSLPAVEEPQQQQQTPAARSGATAIARPLAGPVMPLTAAAEADELVGGASARQIVLDPIATRVLVRGEPARAPAGRADDFAWPRRNVAPLGLDPLVATTTVPMTPMLAYAPESRQAAAAAAGAANTAATGSAGAPARRPPPTAQQAPTRQAAASQQRPGFIDQLFRSERRQQPFFFPFFGR